MRKSGILMPITSLPSRYGIGCFSKSAYDFVDYLKKSGQHYWQILPLGHTGYGDSPYQSFSAFAGNPYMISLETLTDKGLLTKEECDAADFGCDSSRIDYALVYKNRYPLLRKAYSRSRHKESSEYRRFVVDNSFWLKDYSLFMAFKEHFGSKSFFDWSEDARSKSRSLKYASILGDEVDFWRFVQFEFMEQWHSLKEYANQNSVRIIGDMPIYVSPDSADVWANPGLFMLGDDLRPTYVAGCPPDGFSKSGQLWGNPIYNWSAHKKEDYNWWIERIRYSFEMYDVLRIDHFRGFEKYYSIPYGRSDATIGSWEKGPGYELFDAIKKSLGNKDIIAEDLGFITEEVRELLRKCDFCGIKVFEFAFDKRDSGLSADYLPHNYPKNCVAYTGTHDNEPISYWFASLEKGAQDKVRAYLCDRFTPEPLVHKAIICSVMQSAADTVIIPMWDVLGLGNEARINTPGRAAGNWSWRIESGMLTDGSAQFLKETAKQYGRC